MNCSGLKVVLAGTIMVMQALLIGGCVSTKTVTVQPTMDQYVFLQDIEPLDVHYQNLYATSSEKKPQLAARLSEPQGYKIKFHNNSEIIIGEPASKESQEPRTFLFREGVYPFSLYTDVKSTDWYSGLLVVYDIDETIELAMFGENDETRLLNLEMFKQAQKGVLGQYTVTFDDRQVMRYWLGNRDSLYPGGQPSVEVDFSKTTKLAKLTIDGQEVKNFKKVLGLEKYYVCRLCNEKAAHPNGFSSKCKKSSSGNHSPQLVVSHKNYPLELETVDGKRFQGYILNLVTNVFTAFMSIPCEIPNELFDSAAQGTIAKLTVHSPGEQEQKVAEIVFGLAK